VVYYSLAQILVQLREVSVLCIALFNNTNISFTSLLSVSRLYDLLHKEWTTNIRAPMDVLRMFPVRRQHWPVRLEHYHRVMCTKMAHLSRYAL